MALVSDIYSTFKKNEEGQNKILRVSDIKSYNRKHGFFERN